jgi:hypothetical protein
MPYEVTDPTVDSQIVNLKADHQPPLRILLAAARTHAEGQGERIETLEAEVAGRN